MTQGDPAAETDLRFSEAVGAFGAGPRRAGPGEPITPGSTLSAGRALELFDVQMGSRHLDLVARQLRARGAGFYTIGSSGHEGNVVLAAHTRPTDPAFLHYRSGAFFLERARQVPEVDGIAAVLLGLVASREDPISGGRHKVFGSLPLEIPPQTSTIASHLPKAVGMALALERRRKIGLGGRFPEDALVLCSFGDASANHSTAVGAINTACHVAFQCLPLPLLFVCEDNGLGISVPTPAGWIRAAYGAREGLRYFAGDGCDLPSAWDAAEEAVRFVREHRRPAFLHLSTVRLMGHAGSDLEIAYRSATEIRRAGDADPLIGTARRLIAAGALTPDEVAARYEAMRARVERAAEEAVARPRLESAAEIMAPLAPSTPEAVREEALRAPDPSVRAVYWKGVALPEEREPGTLAECLNRALGDLLAKYPEALLFGEDVAKKGGVYGVTRGLMKRAGVARVFDSLLDEQSILGLAMGAAQAGFLPLPEIQYLAYLHNAEDQLRGEAATLQFFSGDRFRNPMVVRIAAYAYQKGFGGHFHNDNSLAVIRDVPGLIIASPGNGADAVAMLRTCAAAAKVDGRVSVFLEPIALYHTRDLFEAGDGGHLDAYDPGAPHVPLGSARTFGDGEDLLIVSFANGVRMSRRVARRLATEGVQARVLDLRWLAPLPIGDLIREAEAVGRVLVVDETRASGGVSEGVIAALIDHGFEGRVRRVTSLDSLIPLGPAADHVLLGEAAIEAAALALVGRADPI